MNLISTGATRAVDVALLTMPITLGILSGQTRLVNAGGSLVIMPVLLISICIGTLQIAKTKHLVRAIRLGGNR